MNTAKHTPGDWGVYIADRICPEDTSGKVLAVARHGITTGEEEAVCIIGWAPFSPEDDANARLIAAAPRMFEVLEMFVNSFNKDDDYAAMQAAKQVIAKATGEQA